ncbi:hypothetical protein HII31_04140 [Pseudocercospora fuligena]|uniref:Uncharacterized protein n=1 Tax=Pseudocercospora fuligena TaxID=685502 RepID=A0A8H6RNG4_9PEZI|nr:hypothetical protein HII31_04140 [Pseudocercospora fuligena]
MCDYTKVEYACGHLRYTVRAWCERLQREHLTNVHAEEESLSAAEEGQSVIVQEVIAAMGFVLECLTVVRNAIKPVTT